MKKYNTFLLLFIIMPFLSNHSKETQKFFEPDKIKKNKIKYVSGTLPDICSILPGSEIEALHIFNNPLTKTYTETATTDVMSTCRYEFFKPNDYPSVTITLVKFDSKGEAAATYHQSVLDHIDLWEREPERIPDIADSASFTLTPDGDKCDECNLYAKQGVYLINMMFKGHYEEVPRAGKKAGAIKIVKMMYERIPGLTSK